MRYVLFIWIILCSVCLWSQDLISRQSPIDWKSKTVDSFSLAYHVPKADTAMSIAPQTKSIPAIIDNIKGWEWVSEEDPDYESDSYPYNIYYYKYKSHPQYKLISGNIYDINGNLVRVNMIAEKLYPNISLQEDVMEELLRQAYIKDYNSNKYNFKKENAKAQTWVKRKLGLLQQPKDILDILHSVSEVGIRFLQQLEKDHANDFRYMLKCERTGNCSFKTTFGNEKWEEKVTYKIVAVQNGKYKTRVTISKLPLEKIDWSQYSRPNEYVENEPTAIRNNEANGTQRYHKVKKGETLVSIARKRGLKREDLCRWNGLSAGTVLKPGQIIKISGPSSASSDSSPSKDATISPKTNPLSSQAFDEELVKRQSENVDTTKIYNECDQMPSFPGGPAAMTHYLNTNVKYPVKAEENGIQGRVIVKIVVDRCGNVTSPKVVKSVPMLDKEALRVIENMPRWIPGRSKGIPVKVYYIVPVNFRLL